MRRILTFAPILLIVGCAHLSSVTMSETDPKTGIKREKTTMRVYTMFDANSALAKAANQSSMSGPTNAPYSPGTRLSGLNQSSSSPTNLTAVLEAITKGAVEGLK